MKTFTSGAKSSEAAPRYDLVPLASIRRQAARMGMGAKSHGDKNYLNGVNDAEFVRDRVNHLIGHALAYASGDRSEDHLGAVLANAGMLADIEEAREAATPPSVAATPRAMMTPFIINEQASALNAVTPFCICGKRYAEPKECAERRQCMLSAGKR